MLTKLYDVGAEIHAEDATLTDCDKDEIAELVREQGYVLLSGFAPTVSEYDQFTAQFGPCAVTRHVRYPQSRISLGFHAEDSYTPYRPDALWFLCVNEGSDGGVPTGVVDGIELLAAMPTNWQEFCRENSLLFERQWGPAVWQGAAEVPGRAELSALLDAIPGITYAFLDDGFLYICCHVGLVNRTSDGREAFANGVLQAAAWPEYYGMSLSDGSAVPAELVAIVDELSLALERDLNWRTGDFGIVDNLRFMHRRRQNEQQGRDLRVRSCENFFGSTVPGADTSLSTWVKNLITSELDKPDRIGPVK
jgi:hypothetical protein